MENMVMTNKFWVNKRVLVTGHTGFKGGWLSLWLRELGASVFGYSLAPTKDSEFYNKVYGDGFIGEERIGDICNLEEFSKFINAIKPQIIFHLAAQPLVRTSYSDPLSTFSTNAMGVVNVLEAVRRSSLETIIINVTTDKVYANKEWIWAYREPEALGGNDPYSASKACSEIITHSYMQSFFNGSSVKVATARAGNVIGGGDMSSDRLIPDYFRSLMSDNEIILRNPLATRPWQHVIEPVWGYLMLAEKLSSSNSDDYIGAWNFGPSGDPVSVSEVVDNLTKISHGKSYVLDVNSNPHEAQALMLDSAKARKLLGWKPKLTLDEALNMTFSWFEQSLRNESMRELTISQIRAYQTHE